MFLSVTQHKSRVEEYKTRISQGETAQQIADSLGVTRDILIERVCYSRKILGMPTKSHFYTDYEMKKCHDMRQNGAGFKYIAHVLNQERKDTIEITYDKLTKSYYRYIKKNNIQI